MSSVSSNDYIVDIWYSNFASCVTRPVYIPFLLNFQIRRMVCRSLVLFVSCTLYVSTVVWP